LSWDNGHFSLPSYPNSHYPYNPPTTSFSAKSALCFHLSLGNNMAYWNAPYPKLYPSATTAHTDLFSFSPVFSKAGLQPLLSYLESVDCLPEFCLDSNICLSLRRGDGGVIHASEAFVAWLLHLGKGTCEKSCQTDTQPGKTIFATTETLPPASEKPLPEPSKDQDLNISLTELFHLSLPNMEDCLLGIDDIEALLFRCYALVGIRTSFEVAEERENKVCRVLASKRLIAEGKASSYRKAKFMAHFSGLARLSHKFATRWLERYPEAPGRLLV